MYAISPHMLDIIKLTLNHRMTGLIHCVTHKFLLHKHTRAQAEYLIFRHQKMPRGCSVLFLVLHLFIYFYFFIYFWPQTHAVCFRTHTVSQYEMQCQEFLFKLWVLLDLLHSYKIDLFHIKSAGQNTLLLKLYLFREHLACACYTLPSIKLDGSTTLSVITYSSLS